MILVGDYRRLSKLIKLWHFPAKGTGGLEQTLFSTILSKMLSHGVQASENICLAFHFNLFAERNQGLHWSGVLFTAALDNEVHGSADGSLKKWRHQLLTWRKTSEIVDLLRQSRSHVNIALEFFFPFPLGFWKELLLVLARVQLPQSAQKYAVLTACDSEKEGFLVTALRKRVVCFNTAEPSLCYSLAPQQTMNQLKHTQHAIFKISYKFYNF